MHSGINALAADQPLLVAVVKLPPRLAPPAWAAVKEPALEEARELPRVCSRSSRSTLSTVLRLMKRCTQSVGTDYQLVQRTD